MKKNLTDFEILDRSAEVLKVLAHPLRLAIVEYLHKQGSSSVTDIYSALEMEQSVASYHLKNLRMVNIVRSQRKGTQIFYTVDNKDIIAIYKHTVILGAL